MAPRTVTVKALQALLTRIGSASSGTKDVLQARFKRDVTKQHLSALRPIRERRLAEDRARKLRIISIDMGIKNLAYCDVEVDYRNEDAMSPTMDIIRWDKLNLVDATQDLRRHQPELSNPRLVKEVTADGDEEVDPYSLSVLSQTAHSFLLRSILEVSPDIILIERQRWRSASSAAIQQWTVRVNTLEAMLWAILTALKIERAANLSRTKESTAQIHYDVFGVDPKRVGHFWLGQHTRAVAEKHNGAVTLDDAALLGEDNSKATRRKEPRSKAEKKAKIAILRSWLSTEPASTAPSTPSSAPIISFTIGAGATTALKALSLPVPKTPRKKKAEPGEKNVPHAVEERETKKLDDITDSCLQVAAWVAWESNKRQLYDVWERKRGKDGTMPDLDDNVLKEMIDMVED